MINLIDYGGGNMGSITRCLQRLGLPFRLACSGKDVVRSEAIILPGVGNFGAVMSKLRQRELDSAISDVILSGLPFLGICVGMQVLFEGSEESPLSPGLKIIAGGIKKFNCRKVPQVGWNRLDPAQTGLEAGYAYFVNSYYGVPADESVVAYTSEYPDPFCAGIIKENITAFQFHPEKSHEFGQRLIRRWADAL